MNGIERDAVDDHRDMRLMRNPIDHDIARHRMSIPRKPLAIFHQDLKKTLRVDAAIIRDSLIDFESRISIDDDGQARAIDAKSIAPLSAPWNALIGAGRCADACLFS